MYIILVIFMRGLAQQRKCASMGMPRGRAGAVKAQLSVRPITSRSAAQALAVSLMLRIKTGYRRYCAQSWQNACFCRMRRLLGTRDVLYICICFSLLYYYYHVSFFCWRTSVRVDALSASAQSTQAGPDRSSNWAPKCLRAHTCAQVHTRDVFYFSICFLFLYFLFFICFFIFCF